jgi:hypothetical protein
VTQTVSQAGSGNTPCPPHPKLLELLERDELDWDDPRHRAMYLQAWLHRRVKPCGAEGGAH